MILVRAEVEWARFCLGNCLTVFGPEALPSGKTGHPAVLELAAAERRSLHVGVRGNTYSKVVIFAVLKPHWLFTSCS